MTINELIYQFIDKGIRLIPQANGGLDVDGPASALTPDLIESLREHKATILRRMASIERSENEPVCRRLDRLIFDELRPNVRLPLDVVRPALRP